MKVAPSRVLRSTSATPSACAKRDAAGSEPRRAIASRVKTRTPRPAASTSWTLRTTRRRRRIGVGVTSGRSLTEGARAG
jgi:hypothetical protein